MSSPATPIPPETAIDDAPYRASLLFGAFSLFFLSFVMSGNGNAVPQLFFQRFYPEQKTVLLSASLLASTLAATAAVVLSSRHRLSQRALITAMLATVMGALALYLTRNGPVFIAIIVLVQFAVNYLTNQLDHASIARAGALRRVNDAAGILARLCGMLGAPAFFTALYDSKTVSLVSVAAIGLLASAGAAKLLMMPAVREAADPASSKYDQPPDRTDSFLFAFAISIYVSLYLFGANIIYLLRDLLSIPHSETRGGVAIVAMFASALLANGLVAILRRKLAERAGCMIRMVPLAVPAVMLFVFGGSIALGFRPGFLIFLAGACALGIAYGAFLWEVRDYASQAAQNDGKSVLVSWFNNMANVSSLIAFAIMLAIAATKTGAHVVYYVWLMCAIACVPLGGVLFLVMASRLLKKASTVRS